MIMNHNEFTAEVGYEDGDRLMHGSVINPRAVLHFEGGNIEELRQALADTIALPEVVQGTRRETGKPFRGALIAHHPAAASPRRPKGREGGREHQSVHRRVPRRGGLASETHEARPTG